MTTTQKATIDALLRELAAAGHPATNTLSGMMLEHDAMFGMVGKAAHYALNNGRAIGCQAAEVYAEVKSGTMGENL